MSLGQCELGSCQTHAGGSGSAKRPLNSWGMAWALMDRCVSSTTGCYFTSASAQGPGDKGAGLRMRAERVLTASRRRQASSALDPIPEAGRVGSYGVPVAPAFNSTGSQSRAGRPAVPCPHSPQFQRHLEPAEIVLRHRNFCPVLFSSGMGSYDRDRGRIPADLSDPDSLF